MGICILSLAAFVAGTYSWFTSKTQEALSSTNFSIYADDLGIEHSIYKYDTTSDSPARLINSDANNFKLNQYDVVFKERNKYNALYVELFITGSNLADSGTITLKLERDTSKPVMDENDYLSNCFTSVTKFAVGGNGLIQNGIYDPASVDNTWDNLNTVFLDEDLDGHLTTQSFTSGTTGSYVKQDYLEFTLNYTSNDYLNGRLVIYLYINYNSTLAETYSLEHGISIEGSLNYTLEDDLTMLSVRSD